MNQPTKFGIHIMTPRDSLPLMKLAESYTVQFENGYGASVVRGMYTYGGPDLYELAVLDHNKDLCYTTPITNDIVGYLTPDEVTSYLDRIAQLPNVTHEVHV